MWHDVVRRPLLALLAASSVAACTANSALDTTPTFSAARYLPPNPSPGGTPAPDPSGPTAVPHRTGVLAISRANRDATVDPDDTTMRGATWYIEDVQPSLIYRVRTAPNRVTTILLPPGERFNGAVGGDVDGFMINVSYAGPRPAVSILPRTGQARGNLQLVTTGGFYSFDLVVNGYVAVNLVDVGRREPGPAGGSATGLPQPQGDFTRLALVREGGPLPAWAPAEAWADSYKMVVRFDGPLPVLPTLLVGGKGEQVVGYRSQTDGRQVYLVTSRRVTEAELRLGSEKVRITVDPDAVRAGTAADSARGAEGWRPAGTLEAPPRAAGAPAVPPAPVQGARHAGPAPTGDAGAAPTSGVRASV
jgi:Conjugal transfer protein